MLCAPSGRTDTPGMNFSADGFGVVSVWMNMLRAGENGVRSLGCCGATGRWLRDVRRVCCAGVVVSGRANGRAEISERCRRRIAGRDDMVALVYFVQTGWVLEIEIRSMLDWISRRYLLEVFWPRLMTQ